MASRRRGASFCGAHASSVRGTALCVVSAAVVIGGPLIVRRPAAAATAAAARRPIVSAPPMAVGCPLDNGSVTGRPPTASVQRTHRIHQWAAEGVAPHAGRPPTRRRRRYRYRRRRRLGPVAHAPSALAGGLMRKERTGERVAILAEGDSHRYSQSFVRILITER